MLRTVFIGSKNEFNEVVVHWLARQVNLVGIVWTSATAWQHTWKGRMRFARQRARRYGVWKTIDEAFFYLYYHKRLHRRSTEELYKKVIRPYWAKYGYSLWQGDSIFTLNVNSREVFDFLQQRQPDIALAMCINNYFGIRLRNLFQRGVLLWHEGITPEYKGLYSPFWAVHNLDFGRLGYTVLRMNDEYDAGEIFAQGPAEDVDPFFDTHCYIGHKAITDSFPQVEKLLREFDQGTAHPIERLDAQPSYYTYPGISDLIRQRYRLRQMRRDGLPSYSFSISAASNQKVD